MPLVSRTFDQLIDFTRTSAGTYVDETGKIVSTPASRNLLLFTQEFDNAAWAKLNGLTVTANSAVAPDSTSTADTLVEPAATSIFAIRQGAVFAAGSGTFSIYVKPNGRNWIELVVASGGSGSAFFNVATGTVGTTSGATATITAAGNGWYRCAIVFTATAGSNFLDLRLASADGITSYTGNGTSGVFIWGAQLEQASAATTYTRNFGGLFPPRFDYDPVTRAPRGLLIEEQRTNLFTRSEEFDNAAWTKSGATITANAATSPDGTVDADRFNATSPGGMDQSVVLVNGTSYTISVWAKSNGASKDTFILYGDGNQTSGVFTATGTWQRFSYTFTSLNSAARGNGVFTNGANDCDILLWGAQLEAGAFATSYIPTVASQVTRTADVAAINAPNFASWYNQTQGTFVASFDSADVSNIRGAIYASDGTSNNQVSIRLQTGPRMLVNVGGTAVASIQTGSAANNTVVNAAAAYSANDFAFTVGGVTPGTDTSGAVPAVDRMEIGGLGAGSFNINGHIRSIRYYPTRLSNAQLQALTA